MRRVAHTSGWRSRARVRTPGCVGARHLCRLLVAVFALIALSQAAAAQTNIYQMRGSSDYGIYVYNTTSNTETTVYSSYTVSPPGTNSATLAQRPSDGMLFYVMYKTPAPGNNPILFRFNPATPNVPPVQVGDGLGATVPSSLRMAFSPTGTLYYLPENNQLYTIDTTTGDATATGITVGVAVTSGGDMAFNSAGTLYVVTSSKNLYTVSLANGAATRLGNAPINVTGAATQPNATIGMAFDSAGRLLVQTQSPNNLYSVALPVSATQAPQAVAVHAGDGDITSTGDMASAAVPAPDLSITKTDNVTTVYRGGPVQYIVTVTNNGTYAVTGTVTDVVPASITVSSWSCAASSGSTCNAPASGTTNNINTSAMLLAGGTATYTINGTVSATATGTITNQASVAAPSWFTDATSANNTASDTDTVNRNSNLAITKTDGRATVNPGTAVTYTIVASNSGPDGATGAAITDTVPALLSSVTWACGSPTGGAACGAASGSGNLNTTANLPSGGSVTYTVTGTLATTATGTLANTAQIAPPSGTTDPTSGNDSATDTDTINLVADPAITKTHTGNFTRGAVGTYTLTVTNNGTGPTSGAVTVTDTLPAGLQPTGPTGTVNGWTCGIAAQTITCSRSDALSASLSYPAIAVTVNVLQTAAGSVTNTATVSGGGGNITTANDSASDPTTVVSSADLSLTKVASNATPTVNQNVIFTLTLSNGGPSNASGVTVTDLLPAGLSFVNATPSAGTAYDSTTGLWTIGAVSSAASATLSITAKVLSSGTITNTAQVTAANEPDPDSTPNNNNAAEDDQASATLTVALPPDVTLCKTFPGQTCVPPPSLPPQLPGADVTFVIIFTNGGGSPAQGLTITDAIPPNMDFKVGSMTANLGSTGLSVAFYYSYDGTNFTNLVLPSSGGGGAPAGYDRTVKAVRWVFTGNLSQNASFNTGDVRFTTRIR